MLENITKGYIARVVLFLMLLIGLVVLYTQLFAGGDEEVVRKSSKFNRMDKYAKQRGQAVRDNKYPRKPGSAAGKNKVYGNDQPSGYRQKASGSKGEASKWKMTDSAKSKISSQYGFGKAKANATKSQKQEGYTENMKYQQIGKPKNKTSEKVRKTDDWTKGQIKKPSLKEYQEEMLKRRQDGGDKYKNEQLKDPKHKPSLKEYQEEIKNKRKSKSGNAGAQGEKSKLNEQQKQKEDDMENKQQDKNKDKKQKNETMSKTSQNREQSSLGRPGSKGAESSGDRYNKTREQSSLGMIGSKGMGSGSKGMGSSNERYNKTRSTKNNSTQNRQTEDSYKSKMVEKLHQAQEKSEKLAQTKQGLLDKIKSATGIQSEDKTRHTDKEKSKVDKENQNSMKKEGENRERDQQRKGPEGNREAKQGQTGTKQNQQNKSREFLGKTGVNQRRQDQTRGSNGVNEKQESGGLSARASQRTQDQESRGRTGANQRRQDQKAESRSGSTGTNQNQKQETLRQRSQDGKDRYNKMKQDNEVIDRVKQQSSKTDRDGPKNSSFKSTNSNMSNRINKDTENKSQDTKLRFSKAERDGNYQVKDQLQKAKSI